MSPLISVTPISDDKQSGLPDRMLINLMHVYEIHPNGDGASISYHGRLLHVAESLEALVGLAAGREPEPESKAVVVAEPTTEGASADVQ